MRSDNKTAGFAHVAVSDKEVHFAATKNITPQLSERLARMVTASTAGAAQFSDANAKGLIAP